MVLPHKNKVGGRNLLFLFGSVKKNKLDFLGVFENFCVVKPQTISVKTLISLYAISFEFIFVSNIGNLDCFKDFYMTFN